MWLVGLASLTVFLLTKNPEGSRLMTSIINKINIVDEQTSRINGDRLVEKINKWRVDNKLGILLRDERLDRASEARLAVIGSKEDFDGKITGLTLEKSVANNGYNYLLIGGLYAMDLNSEDEIIKNWERDVDSKKILGEKTVKQIGLAITTKDNLHQVVVIIGKEMGTGKVAEKGVVWGGPELWEAVNKRRTERGVSPLSAKEELCTIASIRLNQLLELGKLDGHAGFVPTLDRADLRWIKDKYDISEFLITGYPTPLAAVDAWEHTLGHKDLLTGGQFVWGCIYAQDTFGVAITAF